MPNLRDLRKRRKSVLNTKKITRTMELVASAKMKKAQTAAAAARPYAEAMTALVARLAAAADGDPHPLMLQRPVRRVLILIATSDRGLAGAFNANLVNLAWKLRKEHLAAGHEVSFIALGRKAASTLSFFGSPAIAVHSGIMDAPKYAQAQTQADRIMADYLAGTVDQVEMVYAKYISPARQVPSAMTLLPAGGAPLDETTKGPRTLFLFHPDPASLLAALIPQMVKLSLFSALLQTSAGEHAARRVAMKNATDAANDMVKALTIVYNRGRQGKITQEIAEIVGAVEAMS